jgi:Flp pilus assembly protein TadG
LQDKRAGTAIEFAFAAPVVLTMILGVIEFGWAFHCGASIRAAVTRESRQLIANPSMSVDAFQTAVRGDQSGIADPNVTFAFATEAFGSGSATRVSWTYQHPILYPFLPDLTLNFSSSVLVPQ